MTLYKGKYRIESTRLKDWAYSSPGFYFVTICTYACQHFFSHVIDGKMHRAPAGEIVAKESK